MAKATIRVPSFEYKWEGEAENEDEVWENLDSDFLGSLALDKAEVVTAEYDPPEPEPEEEDDSETESEEEKA